MIWSTQSGWALAPTSALARCSPFDGGEDPQRFRHAVAHPIMSRRIG